MRWIVKRLVELAWDVVILVVGFGLGYAFAKGLFFI